MAHIGIHRLPSGDREEDRAEHRKSDARRRLNQVDQGAMRADGLEDGRGRDNAAHPEHANCEKPQQH